jgi:hypothetical protein
LKLLLGAQVLFGVPGDPDRLRVETHRVLAGWVTGEVTASFGNPDIRIKTTALIFHGFSDANI